MGVTHNLISQGIFLKSLAIAIVVSLSVSNVSFAVEATSESTGTIPESTSSDPTAPSDMDTVLEEAALDGPMESPYPLLDDPAYTEALAMWNTWSAEYQDQFIDDLATASQTYVSGNETEAQEQVLTVYNSAVQEATNSGSDEATSGLAALQLIVVVTVTIADGVYDTVELLRLAHSAARGGRTQELPTPEELINQTLRLLQELNQAEHRDRTIG